MIIAAHQANYLPNLGFFYKMAQADLFVVITNIQFGKEEGWEQRHKIPGPNNDIWLTVPTQGSQNSRSKEVMIDNNSNWQRKQKKTLELTYNKCLEKEVLKKITDVHNKQWKRLVELNFAFIQLFREVLGISTPLVLDEEVEGEKQHLLLNICEKYNADTYLSGMGGKKYMTEDYFSALKERNIAHDFISRNLTVLYPYSALHYILTRGVQHVSQVI